MSAALPILKGASRKAGGEEKKKKLTRRSLKGHPFRAGADTKQALEDLFYLPLQRPHQTSGATTQAMISLAGGGSDGAGRGAVLANTGV